MSQDSSLFRVHAPPTHIRLFSFVQFCVQCKLCCHTGSPSISHIQAELLDLSEGQIQSNIGSEPDQLLYNAVNATHAGTVRQQHLIRRETTFWRSHSRCAVCQNIKQQSLVSWHQVTDWRGNFLLKTVRPLTFDPAAAQPGASKLTLHGTNTLPKPWINTLHTL